MRRLIVLALLCVPGALLAQAAISPGMSRAQVEAALGAPATSRTVNEYSYLFYPNQCGKSCGMHDLVILHGDSVVDAIFRSPDRRYTGQSSSPDELHPQVTRRAPDKPVAVKKEPAAAPKKQAAPASKTAASPPRNAKAAAPQAQIRVPAQANDTRPSIPLNEPKMAPAGAKATAPAKTAAPEKAPARKDAKAKQPTATY